MFYLTDATGVNSLTHYHVSVYSVGDSKYLVIPVFLDQSSGADGSKDFWRYCEKVEELTFQSPYGDTIHLTTHKEHGFLLMFLNGIRVVCTYRRCELADKLEYFTVTKASLFYREQWGTFGKDDLPASFRGAPIAQWHDRGIDRALSVARAKPEELLDWNKKGWQMLPSYTISCWSGNYELAPLTGTSYFPVRVKGGAFGDKERFQTYEDFVNFVRSIR